MKKQIFFYILVFNLAGSFGQSPPEEFFVGIELLAVDKQAAKEKFLLAQEKDSLFPGTYHFLGLLSLDEDNIEEGRNYLEKSLFLNLENNNRTREMTFTRLIDSYLQEHDFDKAFELAWVAYQQYPYNNVILHALQDISMWAFYIKHNGLDPSYLNTDLQEEYVVNSVAEEYLILRNILVDGNFLLFESQRLIKKKRKYYDIVTCRLSDTDEIIQIKFRLNWDLETFLGGKVVDTEEVYQNQSLPIQERIGALFVSDDEIDISREIKKLYQEKIELSQGF